MDSQGPLAVAARRWTDAMTRSTRRPPAPSDSGTPSVGHELIDAYANALSRGEAGDPAPWLLGRSPLSRPAPADIDALRAVSLLIRHRGATTLSVRSPGPAAPNAKPRKPSMSDPSDLRAEMQGPSNYDPEWLRSHQLQWLGFLDVLEGGMGAVELAWHLKLKQEVVLKMAREEYLEERFHREIEVHAKLGGHANISVVRTALTHRDASVLVVDYVPGPSLRRHVESNGPMPWPEASDCVRQAAQGLAHAHSRGVIHRDVKSSNLVRSASDHAVSVIDWGLALDLERAQSDERVTRVGFALGTADYCAPEQAADSRSATARSDLYGLGCTWYELLTGEPPFSGFGRTVQNAHAATPVSPLPVELGVPEAVEKVLMKLLEKNPQRRYESAEAFIQALDQAQHGVVKNSAPPWKALAAVAAVVVVLLAAWKFWPVGPQSSGPPAVSDLIIEVADPGGKPGRTGTLGATIFEACEGDEVTIRAELTTPGYAYLIAFRPDGRMDLCAPTSESAQPGLDRSPSYPPSGDTKSVFGLQDGEGLQAFAVVVSHSPLPAFKESLAKAGPAPWHRVKELEPGLVWRSDGRAIKVLQQDKSDDDRGAGHRTRGARGAVADITDWLKSFPGVDAVEVKAFAVIPPKS
jgi:hypothetical protein